MTEGDRQGEGRTRRGGDALGLAAAALALVGLVLVFPGGAETRGALLSITARPVEIGPARLDGVELLGAWALSADDEGFGGLSGLVVQDGHLLAVSDKGGLLEARIDIGGAAPVLSAARLVRMTDPDGGDPGKPGGDAEGLAVLDGQLFVSFERDHRVAPLSPDARIGDPLVLPAFEGLPGNAGLEALAAAGGALLAIPETPGPDGFPVWALDPDGRLLGEGRIPAPPPHLVTDAAVAPDGRLYVLFRDFSMISGVSIRLRVFDLAGEPPLPVRGSERTLAAWEHASGIDNMEAVAPWRDAAGRIRLWLLSDDNFNLLQRTLLLDLAVEG